MGNWGKCDCAAFTQMCEKLTKAVNEQQSERFMEKMTKEFARRILRKTVKRTPTGNYEEYEYSFAKNADTGEEWIVKGNEGKVGGTLRKSWSVSSITHEGNALAVEIANNREYASYVEYGHVQSVGRYVPALGKCLVQPYVDGLYMLNLSIKEVQDQMPAILDKKSEAFLMQALSDQH